MENAKYDSANLFVVAGAVVTSVVVICSSIGAILALYTTKSCFVWLFIVGSLIVTVLYFLACRWRSHE